jgi:hypothetical protein
VRFVVRSWINTFSNSAINAGNISVSILPEENRPAQNPIPTILGIIIALLAWKTSFFVKVVVNTGQEEAVSHLGIISVKNVRTMRDSSE